MNKEFIPYEQALELKELGFDEVCLGYYHTTLSSSDVDLIISKTPDRFYHLIGIPEHFNTLAPLYQQVFRWFREKYSLFSFITNIESIDYIGFKFTFSLEGPNFDTILPVYDTYEEAELACLNKLIKIVKNK